MASEAEVSAGRALPYDQRIARRLAPAIARAGISANQVTVLTVIMAVAAAVLFANGDPGLACWAAGIFVIARFFDHLDGEIARHTRSASRLGYYLDYVAGALSYALMFAGIGIGLGDALGPVAVGLGLAGAVAALISLGLNLDLDRSTNLAQGDAIGYPGTAGFELEDGIYLLAPVTWIGWLTPFFVVAGVGAAVYSAWTVGRVIRARRGAAVRVMGRQYH